MVQRARQSLERVRRFVTSQPVLEVWGDPIAHSQSPALHTAAYHKLQIDWTYGRRLVDQSGFARELRSLRQPFRGLSLTMPLKEKAFAVADDHDRFSLLTRSSNTLLLDGSGRVTPTFRAFNTDVDGLALAISEGLPTPPTAVRILGAGATAASAVVAASQLRVARIDVRARRPGARQALTELAETLGVRVSDGGFDADCDRVDLTISTLPGTALLPREDAERIAHSGGTLFDVAYSPWPTSMAAIWPSHVLSGKEMLLFQAVRQVRIFLTGEPTEELPDEPTIIDAMRAALVTD